MSNHISNNKRRAISTTIAAIIIVILVIIAGVGYGLYLTKGPTKVAAAPVDNSQVITGLAFAHWTAIGDANLTATISQYSPSASLWWYVHDSALNTTTVAYTGSSISATWTKFFKAGPTYWTVYNFSVSFTSSTQAVVTADVWYVIGSGANTKTLYLPYELDYSYQNGAWVLTGDWWGLPSSPGMIYSGVVTPAISSTTTTTTTTTTTSTGSTSSSSGYNSY